jgi:hypothetical protein
MISIDWVGLFQDIPKEPLAGVSVTQSQRELNDRKQFQMVRNDRKEED